MSGYDVEFAHHMSACGWVFEEEKTSPLPGVRQTVPQWVKGQHKMTLSSLQIVLGTHPWARSHIADCLKRGAIWFQIDTPAASWDDPACDGSLSPLLTVEWPDAVTRLGNVVDP